MGDVTRTELGWPAIAFLFAIALFGIVLVGRAPTWPIYVTVLSWWVFVIFRIFESSDGRPKAKQQEHDE